MKKMVDSKLVLTCNELDIFHHGSSRKVWYLGFISLGYTKSKVGIEQNNQKQNDQDKCVEDNATPAFNKWRPLAYHFLFNYD